MNLHLFVLCCDGLCCIMLCTKIENIRSFLSVVQSSILSIRFTFILKRYLMLKCKISKQEQIVQEIHFLFHYFCILNIILFHIISLKYICSFNFFFFKLCRYIGLWRSTLNFLHYNIELYFCYSLCVYSNT